jgi:DNA-binding GntR family transcriptional regulator
LVSVQVRTADAELAARLEVAEGAEVVYRRRHMHAGDEDEIVQIQEGYFPGELVAVPRSPALNGSSRAPTPL